MLPPFKLPSVFKKKNPVSYELKPRTCLDLIHKLREDKILFLDIFGTFIIKDSQVMYRSTTSYYNYVSSEQSIKIMEKYLEFNQVQEIKSEEATDNLILRLKEKGNNFINE